MPEVRRPAQATPPSNPSINTFDRHGRGQRKVSRAHRREPRADKLREKLTGPDTGDLGLSPFSFPFPLPFPGGGASASWDFLTCCERRHRGDQPRRYGASNTAGVGRWGARNGSRSAASILATPRRKRARKWSGRRVRGVRWERCNRRASSTTSVQAAPPAIARSSLASHTNGWLLGHGRLEQVSPRVRKGVPTDRQLVRMFRPNSHEFTPTTKPSGPGWAWRRPDRESGASLSELRAEPHWGGSSGRIPGTASGEQPRSTTGTDSRSRGYTEKYIKVRFVEAVPNLAEFAPP